MNLLDEIIQGIRSSVADSETGIPVAVRAEPLGIMYPALAPDSPRDAFDINDILMGQPQLPGPQQVVDSTTDPMMQQGPMMPQDMMMDDEDIQSLLVMEHANDDTRNPRI